MVVSNAKPTANDPRDRGWGLRRPLSQAFRGAAGPLVALALIVLVFALGDWLQGGNTFLTLRNFHATSKSASSVAIAALGMTVIIIAGGIDLSAGTAIALSATVLAYCLEQNLPAPLAVVAGVATGCIAGFTNGVLISCLRVVPFIVTLGTMTIYLGLAKIIAKDTTVRPLPRQIPHWLPDLVTSRPRPLGWAIDLSPVRRYPDDFIIWPNFAAGVWLMLALAVVLALVLRYTVFGRHVFAVGSNEATARLCGINVPLIKIAVYTLSGLFMGLAGMYQFAVLSTGEPTSGVGMELEIIAAVVIGGGSLRGGRGSVLGTLVGAAMMAVIASGSNQLGLLNPVQDVLIGVIIIAAVTLDQFRQRRSLA
jgi:ribose transport system permease protein